MPSPPFAGVCNRTCCTYSGRTESNSSVGYTPNAYEWARDLRYFCKRADTGDLFTLGFAQRSPNTSRAVADKDWPGVAAMSALIDSGGQTIPLGRATTVVKSYIDMPVMSPEFRLRSANVSSRPESYARRVGGSTPFDSLSPRAEQSRLWAWWPRQDVLSAQACCGLRWPRGCYTGPDRPVPEADSRTGEASARGPGDPG